MTTHHADERPSRNEDEYFARQNAELINQMRSRLDEERQKAERKAHFMKCPKCGADLVERQHGSVTVDECPDCHGFWLDAGELELIGQITQNPVSRFMDEFINLFSHRASGK
jgi:predicted RNA-binding Zn-ribbon protein involved in translation (DUF1610 family)